MNHQVFKGEDVEDSRSSIRKGWLLPSTRQCVWVAALAGLGYLLWEGYAANRVSQRLWDSSATPADLVRAAERWSKQGAQAVPVLMEALSNENPRTRRYAVMGLWQIGKDARPAIPAIRQAVHDDHPFVRREAVYALSLLDGDSPATRAAIAETLGDRDPSVQGQAVSIVSGWGETALPIAEQRLTDSNPAARKSALELLSKLNRNRSEVASQAQGLTEDPDPEVQATAIRIVFQAHAATDAQVLRWLSHDDEGLRLSAIHALKLDPLPLDAIGPLIDCVKRGPTLPAAQRLQRFGTAGVESVPVLMDAQKRANGSDAIELLDVLKSVGCNNTALGDLSCETARKTQGDFTAGALKFLKSIDPERMKREVARRLDQLKEGDETTAREVCRVCMSLPPEDISSALPHFESLLLVDDPEIRSYALWIVRQAKAERSVPALARMLESPEIDNHVWALTEAVAGIGPPAVEALRQPILRRIQGVGTSRDTEKLSDQSRATLMRAAAEIGIRDREFLEYLLLAANDHSVILSRGALDALGQVGGGDHRVLRVFLNALESTNPMLRFTAAVQILNAVGPRPEVAEGLIPLLDDPEVRIRTAVAITLARMEGKARMALEPLRQALVNDENKSQVAVPLSTGEWSSIPDAVRKLLPGFQESWSVSTVIAAAIQRIESSTADPDDGNAAVRD